MATQKQVEANRRNAARSTGPRTDAGKSASAQNATTHGMSAKGVLPDDLKAKESERYAAWLPTFAPRDPVGEFQLQQVVRASLRLEHCQAQETERRIELAQIASDPGQRWDQVRDKDAARLAKSLKRDPEYVTMQLRETPAGRAWLIAQWNHLLLAVPETGDPTWSDTQSQRALDLLGKPTTLRQPMIERLYHFNDAKATRTLIHNAIADLEAEQGDADLQNSRLREVDVTGMNLFSNASLKLIRRYEMAAQRQYDRHVQLLRKGQQGKTPEANQPQPQPQPQPTASEPRCETNPIRPRPATEPRPPQPEIRVDPPAQSPPAPHGNRLHRRKLQARDRHDAFLARKQA